MVSSVYDELALDLMTVIDLSKPAADSLVRFLKDEGMIDYDQLKEYYFDD